LTRNITSSVPAHTVGYYEDAIDIIWAIFRLNNPKTIFIPQAFLTNIGRANNLYLRSRKWCPVFHNSLLFLN
jgi:hypothetical protein